MAKKVSGRARIEADAEKLAAPIAEKHGVYIYDVDYFDLFPCKDQIPVKPV